MAINVILLIVGLIICFGGIYIKRITCFSLGFIWSSITAFITALAIVGFSPFIFLELNEENIISIVVIGIVFGIVSAIYDKICVAVSTFLSFFSISTLFFLIIDAISGIYVYIITAIISFFFSFISVKLSNYTFILFSAITGAFIATFGGYGLYEKIEFYSAIKHFLFNEEPRTIILIVTIILSIIGFFVQLYRFNFINKKKNGNKQKSTKQTQSLQNLKLKLTKAIKKLSNNFIVVEWSKRWYFYIFSIIFVCSEFGLFNYVLDHEILYFIITMTFFAVFNMNKKQIALWLSPMILFSIYSAITYFNYQISIYIFLGYICSLLTSSGMVILVCLFVMLIKSILTSRNKQITFRLSSIISFITVFLSFLVIYYFTYFRNHVTPTDYFYKSIGFTEGILLSIEVIVLFMIFNLVKDLKNKDNDTSYIIKKKIINVIPTLVVFAICFTSVFAANFISKRLEEGKFKTKHESYNEIISIYRKAATEGLQAFYDNQEYYSETINDLLINAYYNYNESIQYALYDIDRNGTKELVISNGETIYDIYTLQNDLSINLFPEETFGYRWNIEILKDGQLLAHGLGGANTGLAIVYSLVNGNIITLNMYCYDNNAYLDSSNIDYFMDEGYEIISEDEYRNIINELKSSSAFDSLKFTTIFESKE